MKLVTQYGTCIDMLSGNVEYQYDSLNGEMMVVLRKGYFESETVMQ